MDLLGASTEKNGTARVGAYDATTIKGFHIEKRPLGREDSYAETVTSHSGLSCSWRDNWPILPEQTLPRRLGFCCKRAFDVIVSGSALVVLSPLFLLTAIAIKISAPAGPVFFCQNRVGYKGRVLKIYKFRTMYVGCCDHSGVEQTRIADDRVFPVGQVLRNKGIDELPQLLNILLGDMSLVGPRPHVSGQLADGTNYKMVVPYYDLRHVVKPGLTGWAQANGLRGPTVDRQLATARIEHDMAYIQNQSLWLDLKIICLTAWREFIFSKAH